MVSRLTVAAMSPESSTFALTVPNPLPILVVGASDAVSRRSRAFFLGRERRFWNGITIGLFWFLSSNNRFTLPFLAVAVHAKHVPRLAGDRYATLTLDAVATATDEWADTRCFGTHGFQSVQARYFDLELRAGMLVEVFQCPTRAGAPFATLRSGVAPDPFELNLQQTSDFGR